MPSRFVHHAGRVAYVAQCGLSSLAIEPEVVEGGPERVPEAMEAEAGLDQLLLHQTLHQDPVAFTAATIQLVAQGHWRPYVDEVAGLALLPGGDLAVPGQPRDGDDVPTRMPSLTLAAITLLSKSCSSKLPASATYHPRVIYLIVATMDPEVLELAYTV